MPDENPIIVYRVELLEKTAASIDGKLTDLCKQMTDLNSKFIVDNTKMDVIGNRASALEADHMDTTKALLSLERSLLEQIGNLKLGMAERFGPGAVAGGASGVIATIIGCIVQYVLNN